MLEFKSVEEMREALQDITTHKVVLIDGKETIVCPTNQLYEDIIWGKAFSMLSRLERRFDVEVYSCDLASEIRDAILEKLEENGIRFECVHEEY